MSISSLRLRNFQKHKDLSVSFSPGVNVITGHTNSGKSAIIRALRWVCLHESKKHLLTHGETKLEVGLICCEMQIMRFANGNENGYEIDGKRLVALGQTQPHEILDGLHIYEINFQSQHDPHFLLHLSPGIAAKQINKLVDLESIDLATAWLKQQKDTITKEIDVTEKRLTNSKEEQDDLVWVEMAGHAYKELLRLESAFENKQRMAEKLFWLIDNILPLEGKICSLKEIAECLELHLVTLSAGYSSLHRSKASISALSLILTSIVEYETLEHLESRSGLLGALISISAKRRDLDQVLVSIADLDSKLNIGKVKEKAAFNLLTETRKTVVCPACKRPYGTPPNHVG